MSNAVIVAGVGALGALLMIVGGWAPWVKVSFGGFGDQTVGGLHGGLDGGLVLGMGFAGLLAAGMAVTAQTNRQVVQIGAGALVLVGAVGLIVVIHDWTTLSSHINQANAYFKDFLSSAPTSGGIDVAPPGFDASSLFHVAKGWGLMLSGVASVTTGLAGAYLFLV
jgi:hypothetical protein